MIQKFMMKTGLCRRWNIKSFNIFTCSYHKKRVFLHLCRTCENPLYNLSWMSLTLNIKWGFSLMRVRGEAIMPCDICVISGLTQWVTVEDCILSDRREWPDEAAGLMQSDTHSLCSSTNGP